MSLTNSATHYSDKMFRDRVRMAMVETAIAVYQEDASTANSPARKAFARRVLSFPDSGLSLLTSIVASNNNVETVAVSADVPDSTIINIVKNSWDRAAEMA